MNDSQLIIALTKGRILQETLPLLSMAGIKPLEDVAKSRKLLFETVEPGVQLLVMRGSDVPTYVRFGSADMGIAGKDLIL
ncbi:MAG: ATP phosphoribosyltransferase, partial [Pseudomonadota bacterium]|nr:ATP phosphoribosyltransferase [Pseudomonadota bacterium]